MFSVHIFRSFRSKIQKDMRGVLMGRRAAAPFSQAFGQPRWVSTSRVTSGMNLIEKIVLKHSGKFKD